MELLFEALEQSILFLPLSLGIYLSYSILKTTDMTTEGSFVLGAGVLARLLIAGLHPLFSILTALTMGAFAGLGVSLIQAKNRINPLIAGIIGLFILYTLNFQIMGRPNIGLHGMFIPSKIMIYLIVLLSVVIILFIIACRFGLMLRAFGSNSSVLKSFGKNVESYRLFGLMLSNVLAALCGILTAYNNGYADLNMGFGMTLTGIGTVVIGKQIINRLLPKMTFNAIAELMAVFMGVYLYFLAMNGFLALGFDPIYLKLFLGLLLIVLLRGKKEC